MKKILNKKYLLVLLVFFVLLVVVLIINSSKKDNLIPGAYITGPTTATYYKKTTYTIKLKSTTDEQAVLYMTSTNFPSVYEPSISLKANKTFTKDYQIIFYGQQQSNTPTITVTAFVKKNNSLVLIDRKNMKVKLIYNHKYKAIPYPIVKSEN